MITSSPPRKIKYLRQATSHQARKAGSREAEPEGGILNSRWLVRRSARNVELQFILITNAERSLFAAVRGLYWVLD